MNNYHSMTRSEVERKFIGKKVRINSLVPYSAVINKRIFVVNGIYYISNIKEFSGFYAVISSHYTDDSPLHRQVWIEELMLVCGSK